MGLSGFFPVSSSWHAPCSIDVRRREVASSTPVLSRSDVKGSGLGLWLACPIPPFFRARSANARGALVDRIATSRRDAAAGDVIRPQNLIQTSDSGRIGPFPYCFRHRRRPSLPPRHLFTRGGL